MKYHRKFNLLFSTMVIVGLLFATPMASALAASSNDTNSQCNVQQVDRDGDILKLTLSESNTIALQNYLSQQGLRSVKDAITASRLVCEHNKGDITTLIIPFVGDREDQAIAHVAVWQGIWNTISVAGAVAYMKMI